MIRRRLSIRSRRLLSLLALAVLLVVGFGVARRHPSGIGWLDDLVLTIGGPCEEVIHLARSSVSRTFARYVALRRVEEENRLLLAELRSLRQQLARLEEARMENRRLRHLLDLRPTAGRRSILAEVVARDPSRWFSSVTIDRGRSDGVRAGLPVVTPEGVVGQVVRATQGNAVVRLATDPNSGIGVMEQENRIPGVLEGRGPSGEPRLKYFDRNIEVELGATIVTSGLDGIFPKGIPVGVVSRIRRDAHQIFQDMLVRPAVDFEQLEEVLVLRPREEPDRPSPTPVEGRDDP